MVVHVHSVVGIWARLRGGPAADVEASGAEGASVFVAYEEGEGVEGTKVVVVFPEHGAKGAVEGDQVVEGMATPMLVEHAVAVGAAFFAPKEAQADEGVVAEALVR